MKKLRPYASYSDSGVPWIGKIPETWRTYPIRAVAVVRNGATPDSKNQDYWDGDIPWFTPSDLDFDVVTRLTHPKRYISEAGYKSCATNLSPPGSVIVSTRAPVGNIGITTTESTTNQGCRTLTPKGGITPSFLASALMAARDELNLRSNGTTFLELSTDSIKSIKLPIPSQEEVEVISSFLDRETARIDTLIAKKTRFIELLKEKRQAVITKAVTKGLDDSVEMKDGSFNSIGQIPVHWELSPVGRALRNMKRTVGKRSAEFKLLSLTTRGVIERDVSENFGKFPESFDTYQEVRSGDFVFCLFDMDETPRTVGRSEISGMITGAYSVFECTDPSYSNYLLYLFLHLDSCKGLKSFYTGLRKTIRPPKFTSIRIPFPPKFEAEAIATHLAKQTARIDAVIKKTERSIELLKEHRAALITAAVTGKIDVREAT